MRLRGWISLVLLSLTLLLLLANTALHYFEMRRVLEKEVIARLQILTDVRSDQIFDSVNSLKADIVSAQRNDQIRQALSFPAPVRDRSISPKDRNGMETLHLRIDEENDLLLVDRNGRLVYVDHAGHRLKYMQEGPPGPWQKTMEKARAGFTLSDIFKLLEEGEAPRFVLYAAGPVYSAEGQFLGIVVIQAEAKRFFSIVQDRTGLGKTGEVELVAQEGEAVFILTPPRYDPDAALTRGIRFGEERGIPAQQAVAGRPGAGRFTDYRGIETVAVFRPLPVEGKRWGIVSKIDWDEATLPIERLFNLLVFFSGVGVLITISVVLTVVHFLVAPISLLQSGAKRLGEGDLDHQSVLSVLMN